MNQNRLTRAKQNLVKYKPIEAERDEGFEGHQEWNGKDSSVIEAQAFFYHAVKQRYYAEVQSFLGILLPQGSEDTRIVALQRLLTNTFSEEALKEALLLSISTGSRPLVEFVLCLFVDCPHLERSGCANSAKFPPHMTPLMLASILNNFPIVQCLLLRGHTIPIPHFPSCDCVKCQLTTVCTRSDVRLVDVMRAISSEAYMWLASTDVLVMACTVAKDLQRLIKEDDLEFIESYRELELNVQRFLAKVSDQAWRSEEFDLLIGNKNHCARRHTELPCPRMEMVMEAEMRQFTASINSQTVMKSIFRSDWYNLGRNPKRDLWRMLRCTLFMPLIVLLHAFAPNMGTTMAVPMARLYSHVCTYFVFFCACVVCPITRHFDAWSDQFNPTVFSAEVYMYLYIFGLAIEKGLLCYRIGPKQFYVHWWRVFDALLIASGLIAANFHFWAQLPHEVFKPTDIDRVHWPTGEYVLIHELSLSVFCILGVLKVFYYLQHFKQIGGSIISVGRCIGKTYTYLIIMAVVIVAFSIGVNGLVGPYVGRSQLGADGSPDTSTTQAYSTLGTSTKNLFWSMFGYLGPSTYITAVGNSGGDMMRPVQHEANSITLEVLGALFHGIIIITVLNLMTSLLVKKADEVLDNEEMEYKYVRAAMISEFLSWETAAPPPFNLLLVPLHLLHRTVLKRRCQSPGWGLKPEENEEENDTEKCYMDNLVVLFNRFLSAKECKYKSVWRTEFPKEEHRPSHVQSMTAGARSFPMDNTYEGWRHRKSYKMKHLEMSDAPAAASYSFKGTARSEAVQRAVTNRYNGLILPPTTLPPMHNENPPVPRVTSPKKGLPPV